MGKKVLIRGGINHQLSREPGFTPEDLAKDDFKTIKKASKALVKKSKKLGRA